MAAPDRILEREHPALRAWLDLGSGAAVPRRIVPIVEGRKRRVYVLAAAGPGGGDVVAKRTYAATVTLERRIYEEILSDSPAASPACYGASDDPEPGFGWLFLEHAGERRYSSQVESHRRSMASWLAGLHGHASRAGRIAGLPDRGPAHYLARLRAARAQVRSRVDDAGLPEERRCLLERVAARFDALEGSWGALEQICDRYPRTLVHGDLSAKNVRIRPTAARIDVVAFDWEMAGWGPPAADLARLEIGARGSLVAPDLATYARHLDPGWPRCGERELRDLAAVGSVFRIVSLIDWMVWRLAPGMTGGMSHMTLYDQKLQQVAADPAWRAHRACS